MKTCTKCKTSKPLGSFSKQSSSRSGLRPDCKACARTDHERYMATRPSYARSIGLARYGMSIADYDAILISQDGGCAICRKLEQPGERRLCVDHIHVDGYSRLAPAERKKHVRGLLCDGCNVAIGRMEDSASLLRAAAEYVDAPAWKRNMLAA